MRVYRDDDRLHYLGNLFRLQLAAGQFGEAVESLSALRALRAQASARVRAVDLQYEIYARAKAQEARTGESFEATYPRAFHEVVDGLDGPTSAYLDDALTLVDAASMRQSLDEAIGRQKTRGPVSLSDALPLIGAHQDAEAYRSFAPLTAPLIAADDSRRYIVERDVPVRTPDGVTVCALIVRPRAGAMRLPALLQFTIYADARLILSDARRAAAHGYAGVVGLTRGKGCSPDQPVPYEHDGADAAALIDWISTQPWSDGRTGMYGGSYSGFTPWAAARHGARGLKAIMVGAPVAPGVDVPMEGGVFWNFIYPWPFYTLDNKTLDNETYGDAGRWRRLNREWYVSGRAYRDLEKIDGTPNPIFGRWISHPTYDAYWRALIPYGREFARVHIPVLQTAGYYYGGPGAAVYYFREHHRHDALAQHYLLIGPYDHFMGQRGTIGTLGGHVESIAGCALDPTAQIDMIDLRYQWFDHVLKAGPRPALLADQVNYEVTGANVWKHARSLDAMASGSWTLYLDGVRSGDAYRLSEHRPAADSHTTQTVDLADRTDVDRPSTGGGVLDTALDTTNGLEFVGEPLGQPTELSGLFSGHLEFTVNKKDFDFQLALYELTSKGEYVQLAPFWARASQVHDPRRRQLLAPSRQQRLDFHSSRLMSRLLQAGSRMVAVLSVIKEPEREINYGTGKEVAAETIADAKEPLRIEWLGSSYVVVPVAQ